MALHLYNTLTNTREPFRPMDNDIVTLYTCGPTVYKSIHIGNYRAYIFADVLRRTLEHRGYGVRHVTNLTDVGHMTYEGGWQEDKVEREAKRRRMSPYELCDLYSHEFFRDRRALRLREADVYPRATAHVDDVIALTEALLKNGMAYEADGTVYFSITEKHDYGKLSNNRIGNLTASVKGDRTGKRNKGDFALWIHDPEHMLQWESPWGNGYPGWHMECSTLAARYLTDAFKEGTFDPDRFSTIDIHTGGEDNLFPHHECEIAQIEGATGQKFANYWVHVHHLLVDGEKMSKSQGNFYTVPDLMEKGFSPVGIRYALMKSNHMKNANVGLKELRDAERNIDSLNRTKHRLEEIAATDVSESGVDSLPATLEGYDADFEASLDRDLDVSGALGTVFRLDSYLNRMLDERALCSSDASLALRTLASYDEVLAIYDFEREIPSDVTRLVEQREEYRKNADYSEADALRRHIREKGYQVNDTRRGPQILVL